MFNLSKKSIVLFLIIILSVVGLGWLFDVKGMVLLKYDKHLDSKITNQYAFFQQEVIPILLKYGKKYDLSNDQDTTNWKTYENKEFGFSFKYPEKSRIDEENAGKINDDGSVTLADIVLDEFTIRVSAFGYDRDAYVYHGPHHAKRVFQNTARKGSDAVNYVRAGDAIGYAGYFPVNPWNAERYNGSQYVSRFTFYLKNGMVDFDVRRWGWAYLSKEKQQVYMNLQKGFISTVSFDL